MNSADDVVRHWIEITDLPDILEFAKIPFLLFFNGNLASAMNIQNHHSIPHQTLACIFQIAKQFLSGLKDGITVVEGDNQVDSGTQDRNHIPTRQPDPFSLLNRK